MGKSNQLNTLLVEILIAVVFFAFCAMVVVETFVITSNQSRQAGVYNVALVEAQNVADTLYASADFAEALKAAGFEQDGQGWTRAYEDYALLVTASQEAADAGVLLTAEVSVIEGEDTLFTLPCLRYVPEEVRP